jgi:hypothetical protein
MTFKKVSKPKNIGYFIIPFIFLIIPTALVAAEFGKSSKVSTRCNINNKFRSFVLISRKIKEINISNIEGDIHLTKLSL